MTGIQQDGSGSPIENLLDQLVVELSTRRPRELRHLLAEAEAHLRDDASAAMADGATEFQAEEQAVARFGPARDLAAAERDRLRAPIRSVLRQIAFTALLLGGIAGVGVGLSGVIAAALRGLAGPRFLAGVTPGQVLPGADCARWLAADPQAGSCANAATTDWAAEVVYYRVVLGVLALVVLMALRWLYQRAPGRPRWSVLPAVALDSLALAGFGVAGGWTLGRGIDAAVVSAGTGSGQWFSAAPVALAAAAVFGTRLVRDLRREPA